MASGGVSPTEAKIDVNVEVDPKEDAKAAKSILSKESLPAFAEQSGTFADWQRVRDNLGDPFDSEGIPLRKLLQMRNDAMIAFALHYTKIPLIRAQWHMEARDAKGPNAQVSAFMDAAWRIIHADYMDQALMSMDFGFQGLGKRFQVMNPGGVYVDPLETDPESQLKPTWSEGNVQPIVWNNFVPLNPGAVQPRWNADGTFNGITHTVQTSDVKRAQGTSGNKNTRDIDIYHALWVTNERNRKFGSIYGYPRIAHAYRYWWSYWFRWAMVDRAFERQAIPPLVAYHPPGTFTDADGAERAFQDVALEAARRLRANSIAAVPSTLAKQGMDKVSDKREWEFEFVDTKNDNFRYFDESFGYLDVMKLRSIWVPEQAFVEGEGGTSSRNVATQMAEVFFSSQAVLWDAMALHINKYILPDILQRNFPDFVNNGGTVKIIGHGFQSDDIDLLKQLIQLVGQADPSKLGIDMNEALRRVGAPILTPEQQAQQRINDAATAAAAGTPPVAPTGGAVGTIPISPQALGGQTNGGSVPQPAAPGNGAGALTGFSDELVNVYIAPNEVIELSDDADFIADLPDSKHYSDKAMKALAVQLRRAWRSYYASLYPEFAKHVNSKDKLEFQDDEGTWTTLYFDTSGRVPKRAAQKAAKKLLDDFALGGDKANQAINRTRVVLVRMLKRANFLEAKSAGGKYSLTDDEVNTYVDSQVARLLKKVQSTVKDELKQFLVTSIQEGQTPKVLAKNLRANFSEFPGWKADRLARSETRDAYNMSTLLTGEGLGYRYVKAKDGTQFDERCRERNGKLFTTKEARKEMGWDRTHPNDTLAFEIVPRAITLSYVNTMPDEADEEAAAFFDDNTDTVYLLAELEQATVDTYLGALTDTLVRNGSQNGHTEAELAEA